jgi:hypothetical protein
MFESQESEASVVELVETPEADQKKLDNSQKQS